MAFNLGTINAQANLSCSSVFSKVFGARKALQKTSAEELAAIIAIDDETRGLVAHPLIAQYIYLNHFAEKTVGNELKVALQDIVDSFEVNNVDLYTLVNETLEKKINDPAIQAQVKEVLGADDAGLRPTWTKEKTANIRAKANQLKGFFGTVKRLKEIIYEGFSAEAMDHGLFDFFGATQLGLRDSQLRRWDKIDGGFSAIRPGQIENISADTWTKIAHFTSETEAPIVGYSTGSGEITRGILPSLSIFLGKTTEEHQAFERKEDLLRDIEEMVPEYCSSVWCSEENRHDLAIKTIGEHASGKVHNEPQTYQADKVGDFSNVQEALNHLIGRNASEWNANSIYFFLRAHSKGATDKWVDNIRQDETKHMAIFSSAFRYFYGSQPMVRTKGMLDKIVKMGKSAAKTNSNSNVLKGEGLGMFELLITHLLVEKKVRDFIKTVPLKTMDKFFEAEVKTMQRSEADPVPPEKQALLDKVIKEEKENRLKLSRWKPKERAKYLALRKVEKDHSQLIEALIRSNYKLFAGAEVPNSKETRIMIRKIRRLKTGLDKKTNDLIIMSLEQTLRDYQIMSNRYVRANPALVVRFMNAMEGFTVEKRQKGKTEAVDAQPITTDYHSIKLKKPSGLDLEPGHAIKVTIQTGKGDESRVLSLANSPKSDIMEFGVGGSKSNFKQVLTQMVPGSIVEVAPVMGGLKYNSDRPAVMIAGGIGITPFKSILESVGETGFKSEVHLLQANRSEIPFKEQFDALAEKHDKFSVSHILSQPDGDWNGAVGRINEEYLRNYVASKPKNSVYYIVGATAMVEAVQSALVNVGVPKQDIHIEAFIENKPVDEPEVPGAVTDKDSPKDKDEEVLCRCQGVSIGAIKVAISSGADSLSKVQDQTMAGTGCGNCICSIKSMISCGKN